MGLFKRTSRRIDVSANWVSPSIIGTFVPSELARSMRGSDFMNRMRLASDRASSDVVRDAIKPAFHVLRGHLADDLRGFIPDLGVALSNGYALATLEAEPPQPEVSGELWDALHWLAFDIPREKGWSTEEAFWFSYAMRVGFYLGCAGPAGVSAFEGALAEYLSEHETR